MLQLSTSMVTIQRHYIKWLNLLLNTDKNSRKTLWLTLSATASTATMKLMSLSLPSLCCITKSENASPLFRCSFMKNWFSKDWWKQRPTKLWEKKFFLYWIRNMKIFQLSRSLCHSIRMIKLKDHVASQENGKIWNFQFMVKINLQDYMCNIWKTLRNRALPYQLISHLTRDYKSSSLMTE